MARLQSDPSIPDAEVNAGRRETAILRAHRTKPVCGNRTPEVSTMKLKKPYQNLMKHRKRWVVTITLPEQKKDFVAIKARPRFNVSDNRLEEKLCHHSVYCHGISNAINAMVKKLDKAEILIALWKEL